jgi:SAM-dependent methyltransferase
MILSSFAKEKISQLSKLFKAKNENSALTDPSPPRHCCPVCSQQVNTFDRLPDSYYNELDKNGFIFSIFQFETLNYARYLCPACGSSDRDRLCALYLGDKPPEQCETSKGSILDFAPAKRLQQFIRESFPKFEYRSADLARLDVDDLIDISNMEAYANDSFDFFVCSHILEHVEQDQKAMKELFRILKPGGKGIAMVPIMLTLQKDYEITGIITPEQRWKHFGQDDHVRMYSKSGFTEKLSLTGFKVNEFGVEYFGSERFNQSGIHARSVLYVVEKPCHA